MKKNSKVGLLSLSIVLLWMALPLSLVEGFEIPANRKILAIYDSDETEIKLIQHTYIHQKIESVFNHYGFVLQYLDAKKIKNRHLKRSFLGQFYGAVSWFEDNELENPKQYLRLMRAIFKNHLKFIILGEVGVQVPLPVLNRLIKPLGIEFTEIYEENPLLFKILFKDKDMMEFERTLFGEIPHFSGVKSLLPENRVYLTIQNKADISNVSDLVITTPEGGIALNPFLIFIHPQDFHSEWYFNPFLFIREALGLKNHLIPDLTTLNGQRIYFSHIDGDGFVSIADLDRKSTCATTWLKEIAPKNPLPISVSIIEAEISPHYFGKKEFEDISREIFNLPFVEPASHSFTHPLLWRKDASKEEIQVYGTYKKGGILAFNPPGYKIDYEREIKGSIDYINKHLAPPNKKTNLIFWSGDTTPPEEAMALTAQNGYLNINGGDARFDGRYPSYSHLAPIGKWVGKYFQVYTGFANENLFTNLWHGPFSGFIEVIESFKRSERPFRVKPINLYYHFYAVEKISSVRVLKEIYKFVNKQAINPIFTSHYIKMANAFNIIKIQKVNQQHFQVSRNQPIRTLRMDQSSLFPDLNKSTNIIGFRHFQQNLYLFLGQEKSSKIILKNSSPKKPFIHQSNCLVDQFKTRQNKLTIKGFANIPCYLHLKNLPANQSLIHAGSTSSLKVNNTGELRIPITKTGSFNLQVVPKYTSSKKRK